MNLTPGEEAIAVDDEAIQDAQTAVATREGLLLCPEGAATFAGYQAALERNLVSRGERAVLFNCGNGLKYPMPPVDRALDHTLPIDWEALAGA